MNAPLRLADTPRGGGPGPHAAVFGEWNTSNLGDRGIHEGVRGFMAECGWQVSSYGISTLTPVTAGPSMVVPPPAATDLLSDTLTRVRPLKRALRGARQALRIAALAPHLERSDAIVVGGGALLSDQDLHFPQSLSRLARSARALGKPLLCLGCGIEGEWSARGERMIVEFLLSCDVIAVRDSVTADRLAGALGAAPPLFGDFCLSEAGVAQNGEGEGMRTAYAVNVGQLPGAWASQQARYEAALARLIERLARRARERNFGIRIFTTGTAEDARAARRVYAGLDATGVELHLPDNLAQLTALLGTSALVVSARLHAAILALAQRAPVVGFSASPKVHEFLSTLGIGRHAYDVAEAARLAEWLAAADFDELRAEQRRAIVHAPVWSGRARVRRSLELLAGAVGACK